MTATAAFDQFARSVRERLFAPGPDECRHVGAEIEMLPMLADSSLPCPLEPVGHDPRSTLSFLRPYGAALGWSERRSAKGAPYFALPNGWTLTFEPGGQLELCTKPATSVAILARNARETLAALQRAAGDAGISLVSVGIDPHNAISRVPLQLESERYVAMTRYFDTIGPSGVRMMRQTAATQVSVDAGREPAARWRLLSEMAPFLTAMFANSSWYAGRDTGHQSFRATCWRRLDPSRTGVPHPELPASEAYTRFAVDAIDMMRTDAAGRYRSFGDWAADGGYTTWQWENHLTTLFPEVRPRGHLEVRSIDALQPEMLGAALVLVAGLVYDQNAAAAADRLLPVADEELLNRVALCGMHDGGVAAVASDLARIGLRGAAALGSDVVDGAELERASAFFDEFTFRGRAPADAR